MSDVELILAIDQGTTTTKGCVIDARNGTIRSSAARHVGISFPNPGLVEQDADEIWQSVVKVVSDCLEKVPVRPSAVAISSQRESVVGWLAASGDSFGPLISWQDGRTVQWCGELALHSSEVLKRTGLRLDPMFSAPKVRWLLEEARRRGFDLDDVRIGTVDSWLVRRLTGETLIEAGNASRTLLFSLRTLDWDPWLLDLFGVPRRCLPEIRGSDEGFGSVQGVHPLLEGVPVSAVLADSHAALFLHSPDGSAAKCTYGTGSSVMVGAETPLFGSTIATTLAWVLGDRPRFALEGNILSSGAALDWLARMIAPTEDRPGGVVLSDLASLCDDAGGVSFVPALSGLGAPHWDRTALGTITGLTAATTRSHLARAGLEAVAHQVCDVVEAMAGSLSAPVDRLVADGGASSSRVLMQIQADLLGFPLEVNPTPEASALGVASLAARKLGYRWATDRASTRYEPQIETAERNQRRARWTDAVRRARGQAVTS